MKMLKTCFCLVFASIILIFLIYYFTGNNMDLYGDWIVQATEVNVEWYDYKGIHHLGTLSDSEKAELNILLEDVGEKRKLFLFPESRTGISYNIYCNGIKDVQYTIKNSGIIVVQNMNFPYQYSIWNINQEKVNEIIKYIENTA